MLREGLFHMAPSLLGMLFPRSMPSFLNLFLFRLTSPYQLYLVSYQFTMNATCL